MFANSDFNSKVFINTEKVESMVRVFDHAIFFNQDLSFLNIKNVLNMNMNVTFLIFCILQFLYNLKIVITLLNKSVNNLIKLMSVMRIIGSSS